jgi:hypothetical protein
MRGVHHEEYSPLRSVQCGLQDDTIGEAQAVRKGTVWVRRVGREMHSVGQASCDRSSHHQRAVTWRGSNI